MQNRFVTLLNLLLLIVILVVLQKLQLLSALVTGSTSTPLWDFEIYRRMASDVLHGAHPYRLSYMQTLGPPSVIIPFLPFALVGLTTSVKIYFVCSLVVSWLAMLSLAKKFTNTYRIPLSLFFMLVLITSFPARFTLILGQLHFFAILAITVVLLRSNAVISTIATSVLLILKTYFIFPLLLLVREKRVSWLALGVMLVFGLLSLVIIKPVYYVDFIQDRLFDVVVQSTAEPSIDYYNQSLKTSLLRVGAVEVYLPLYLLLLVVVCWQTFFKRNYEVAVIGSILLSPVLWQHYVVMIFPIIVVMFDRVKTHPKALVIWFLGFSLWWIEFPWIHWLPLNWLTGILASHYFISLVVFLGLAMMKNEQIKKIEVNVQEGLSLRS